MPQTKPAPKPVPPPELQETDIATLPATALLAILKNPASSEFRKAKACVRLGELGAVDAIPALAALLNDEHLSVYARYGLEPIASPAASAALRNALSTLKGVRLIGVINSINKRRDPMAAPLLAPLLYNADPEIARAAAAAIGSIAAPNAVKELQSALTRTTGLTQMAVADASLLCAERLLESGKRVEALALYASLSAPAVPKPVRLAAMAGIIREETSQTRPR
jgi:HEAT repeat protein